MSDTNRQKAKLLLLKEILGQDSDEQNPLTTHELLCRLEQKGISCDRRTLSKDIADLNELGFEVMSVMIGHKKAYYVDDRQFNVPELRILMDAVQAADFIPPEKSAHLVEKIAALGGSYRAHLLQENTVLFNSCKHRNESVFYTIDTIESAFSQKRKVSFLYFDLDEHANKRYRKDGQRYVVEPVGLVLDQNKYYLTALSPDRPNLSIYRIDRMDNANVEREPISAEAAAAKAQVSDLTQGVFKMFAGKFEWVTLEFEERLTGYLYDHFGEQTKIEHLPDQRCRAQVKVQISPTFFGWLFQFGGAMKLTEPARVVDQIRDLICELPY